MSQYDPSDVDAYKDFEEFFVRHHKKGSRPISESDAIIVADSRVVVYESLEKTKTIWIKGKDFTLENLLQDIDAARGFGPIASFRLSPQDYHRYHSPVDGKVVTIRSLPGDYYNVDPLAVRSQVDILTRNARSWVMIETEFGRVVFVAIGATDVGSVQITCKTGDIKKGDEIGFFQFGGSSIVVAFEKIKFDDDLLEKSKDAIAVDVEVGMSLGSWK
jgi:phosphatidylserine decarboxylase